jgi:uncharacterized membrane protein
MPTPRPQLAFLVAAVVLLALPLLAMVGLLALGAAAMADIGAGLDGVAAGEVSGLFVVMSVLWILLLVAAILALVWRLTRQTTRV